MIKQKLKEKATILQLILDISSILFGSTRGGRINLVDNDVIDSEPSCGMTTCLVLNFPPILHMERYQIGELSVRKVLDNLHGGLSDGPLERNN